MLDSRTVLVVEDDDNIARPLCLLLRQLNLNISRVASKADALCHLDARPPPDVVLLDVHLPDGLGTDVLRRIREQNLPVRVAVMTATTDSQVLREVLEMEPSELFLKPQDMGRLLSWVETQAA